MNNEKFSKIQSDYRYFRDSLAPFYERIRRSRRIAEQEDGALGTNAKKGVPEAKSGHIFNAIQYKHADFMDNFPHVNVLPREESDEGEAEVLSQIIPCILDHARFKDTYNKNSYIKLQNGSACYGVFWDKEKDDGRGDVSISLVQLDRLSWQPNISDIQDSRYVFYDYLMEEDEFRAVYGELDGTKTQTTYEGKDRDRYDDSGNFQVVITDCYYKARDKKGKKVLHLLKFSGNRILEETEGKEEYANGFYEHGKYPFVVDVLHPLYGDITGIGLVELGESQQKYIDKFDQIISEAALYSARPRYFKREGMSGINESQFLDLSVPLVDVAAGSLDETVLKRIEPANLPSFIPQHRKMKIDELKEVLGNRDFSQGGTEGGVTAASAIAALQSSGDKLSRDMIGQTYTAISEIIMLVVELIRQFYNEERTFRVTGDDETTSYIKYSNENIKRKEGAFDKLFEFLGFEVPKANSAQFDIVLSMEKNNPYNRGQHNQLILTLHQMGLLNPQNAQVGCFIIQNLSFDGKEKILEELRKAADAQQNVAQEDSSRGETRGAGNEEMLAVPIGNGAVEEDTADEMIAVPINEEMPN